MLLFILILSMAVARSIARTESSVSSFEDELGRSLMQACPTAFSPNEKDTLSGVFFVLFGLAGLEQSGGTKCRKEQPRGLLVRPRVLAP